MYRNSNDYSWNKHIKDDDDDIKSNRYPVVRELPVKNNLNYPALNSPLYRNRIQSTTNNIQSKSHNNLNITDRIGKIK